MKTTKAVIPIAGKGTRFLPASKQTAKELIPILNVPMVHHVVAEAIASGIQQIILVTSAGKQDIENFYDRNFELEEFLAARGKLKELELVRDIGQMANIVSVRQKEQLGLGHAILCAKNLITRDENFAVLLGDDLTIGHDQPVTRQLLNISQKYHDTPVVGVLEVPLANTGQYGIIDGHKMAGDENTYKMLGMVEKPVPEKAPSNLATPGRYILPYRVFDILEETPPGMGGELQLTDAINKLCEDRQGEGVLAHRFAGDRYDTGSIRGYFNATLEFALKDDNLREYAIGLMKDKIKRYE